MSNHKTAKQNVPAVNGRERKKFSGFALLVEKIFHGMAVRSERRQARKLARKEEDRQYEKMMSIHGNVDNASRKLEEATEIIRHKIMNGTWDHDGISEGYSLKRLSTILSSANSSLTYLMSQAREDASPQRINLFEGIRQNLKTLMDEKWGNKVVTLAHFGQHNVAVTTNDQERLDAVIQLKTALPGLTEIVFEDMKAGFEIPEELAGNGHLREAATAYKKGLWRSTLVSCRVAYEEALEQAYWKAEGKAPKDDIICRHCKNTVTQNVPMGISKLHRWAIKKKLVTDGMQHIGFLVTDLGASGAHSTLGEVFPNNKSLALLGANATISLLQMIGTNLPKVAGSGGNP